MVNNSERLPRNLGGYELIELVGAGGMGTVYRAVDRRSGTTVAVKIIHEHLRRDPTFLERFRDEAHLASLITSPYIVRVIEFGSDQGQYYLAAEYVEGSRLADLIESKRLTIDESLAIASQVAMALQAAAAHRVVHRDVKPDNIIITPDSFVKLMDFGVARLSYVETRQLFLGTVAYAAPEQFRGQTTIRSDIYSLGVVLFQMLAGELPFKGDTLSSLIRMHEETTPPIEKLSRVPQALKDVVTKCLEKDPDKRYQDPSELLEALRQVRRGLTTSEDTAWMAQTMTGLAAGTMISPNAATLASPDGTVRLAAAVKPGADGNAPREVYRPGPPAATSARKRNLVPIVVAGLGALALAVIVGVFVIAFSSDGKSDVLLPESTQAAAVVVPATSTALPPPTEVPAAVPTIPPTPLPLPTATQAPPIFVPPTTVAPPVAPPVVVPPVVAPPPPAAPTNTPVPAGPTFTFAGFSDSTGGPKTASGGSLQVCNPASLYAYVNHRNLQPPSQFVGIWTLNGAFLSRFTNTTRPELNGQTFWQVQGSPTPLSAGTYRFELSVDGSVVSSGSFTLTC